MALQSRRLVKTNHFMSSFSSVVRAFFAQRGYASVLAWPAWLRVLAVAPAVALLWLAVAWASVEAAPW